MFDSELRADHEYFEELCALAALGELSADELRLLQNHVETCASCSLEQEHYVRILRCQLPLIDVRRASLPTSIQSEARGYRERFLSRARKQGFRFSPRTEQRRPALPLCWVPLLFGARRIAVVSAMVLLVFAAGMATLQLRRAYASLHAEKQQNSELGDLLLRTQSELQSHVTSKLASIAPPAVDPRIDKRVAQLQERLMRAVAERARLQSDVESGNVRVDQLSVELQGTRTSLRQLADEARTLRTQHNDDAVLIAAQEANIAELSQRVSAEAEALRRVEHLLALNRDIRDLMTARSLHIIDVHDVDSQGKLRRPFGRAFYTEGKSLVFYAYDLPTARNAKDSYSFQAWGYKEPGRQQAQSLGIFYVDDKSQNRWALRVDDPNMLAQIDGVFVTIEPEGGSGKPTGKRLLYAYLNGAPNHP